ncbi:hypothetical protein V5799_009423 [Amblyomma americanum]|uniref:Serine/threonine-protein kinase greatwall n=1 Tax=Amblyomma americanum TaxID=6943 RepID=A0AAQ4FBT3_AMBAM
MQGAKTIPKVTTVLLEFFIKRESKVSLFRDPLSHFCQEQVVLAAQDCLQKLNRQVITFQDIRDMIENLIGLHSLCMKRAPETAKELGTTIRKLTIIIGELATSLEKICEVSVTDWMAIGDSVVSKTDKLNLDTIPPYTAFIPKMKEFKPLKLLGAGGFGAVYKAMYVPASYICTVKLVAMDRFTRHKQACIDKVVASVIRSPFLVKYYCCFCAKDSYVTMMEYISGVDLMRVVTKATYLNIEHVQVVMAQLILALEHLHLRGFLHRDVKVSNMLIVPGGRVKLIDFDTNKVCLGHFSKRLVKGYFARTAFEFHDGESAGTIPYMAPEILKRRPYGRACDWWSSGIVFYKLMTGRVPFRGRTKQLLRDRIIGAPLKWPKTEEHPHSATPEAKDMVFKLLRKNPIERLASRHYQDLKNHPFFSGFNWKALSANKFLCDITAIAEAMGGGLAVSTIDEAPVREGSKKPRSSKPPSRGESPLELKKEEQLSAGATTNTKKRKLQKIEDMIDMEPDLQKPLYTYATSSFKKLVITLRAKKSVEVDDNFMNTSGVESSEIDYRKVSVGDSMIGAGAMSGMSETQTARSSEKLDVILFRRRSLGKFWSFGVNLERVKGEGDKFYYMVEKVANLNVSTTGKTIYPGDIVTHLDDIPVESLTQTMMKTTLAKTKAEVKVTIAAISPLRKRRPSYTRLHETVMTDTNIETPSSDAFVNDGKTE